MPESIDRYRDPFVAGLVTISAGGANQITFVECVGAPTNAIVTISPANDMKITHVGDEGAAVDLTKAFTISTGGLTEIATTGWGREDGVLRLRLSSSTPSGTAEVLVTSR